MSFEGIIGQDRVVRFLRRAYKKNRIPHALLFTGIPGTGKRTTALALARLLQCQSARGTVACGICPSCKKIDSGNHPDLVFIKPSGVFIKTEQIRTLRKEFVLKPFEGNRRIAIISDAHTMNLEAANTFLKILEEPPRDSFMILTAHQVSDLLPTIISRCQHIAFAPLPPKLIAEKLVAERKSDRQMADIEAIYAQGSLGMALQADLQKVAQERDWMVEQFSALSLNRMNHLLSIAEILSKDKDNLLNNLEILKVWVRDILFGKLYPKKILNKDLVEKIDTVSRRYSVSSLLQKIKIIQVAQIATQKGRNRQLVLEVMFIRLCQEA
jgi:DNA polymerase-3 subunit delta'